MFLPITFLHVRSLFEYLKGDGQLQSPGTCGGAGVRRSLETGKGHLCIFLLSPLALLGFMDSGYGSMDSEFGFSMVGKSCFPLPDRISRKLWELTSVSFSHADFLQFLHCIW